MELERTGPEPNVEYRAWAPLYHRIAEEFSFPFAAEEASAHRLEGLLPAAARSAGEGLLRTRLRGRDAVIVGLAPGLGAPPIARLPHAHAPAAIVAADGAADRCLKAGLVPDVVVTDLDGPVPSEVSANSRGALVLIHAHGDNADQLDRWVPQFPGTVAGSWAGPPRPALMNFGGFTDGDRAAYLAEAMGATRLLLFGFDFDRVEEAGEPQAARKRAKLRWARRAIDHLAERGNAPVILWRSDGTQVPWQLPTGDGESSGPSTQ